MTYTPESVERLVEAVREWLRLADDNSPDPNHERDLLMVDADLKVRAAIAEIEVKESKP